MLRTHSEETPKKMLQFQHCRRNQRPLSPLWERPALSGVEGDRARGREEKVVVAVQVPQHDSEKRQEAF